MEQQRYARIASLGWTGIAVFFILSYFTIDGRLWINDHIFDLSRNTTIVMAFIAAIAGLPIGIIIGEIGYLITTYFLLRLPVFRDGPESIEINQLPCKYRLKRRENWLLHAYNLYFDQKGTEFVNMLVRRTTTFYLNANLVITILFGMILSFSIFALPGSRFLHPGYYVVIIILGILIVIFIFRARQLLREYGFLVHLWELRPRDRGRFRARLRPQMIVFEGSVP